jgi:small subunit ribosomal protein S2
VITKIDEMVKTGVHFGHQAKKWNPKMAPYIYAEKNGIHIIDLVQTYFFLKKACNFLTNEAAQGKTFLFVGTKKQASRLIAKVALNCDSFYVNQRWLGGMLTNWRTIKTSIDKLNQLQTLDFSNYSKKEIANLKKEKERLQKYLGGLKTMTSIPDVVIIVGQPEELNAVRECQKLGLRSVTILDTDCDPTLADLFVPANDDSVACLQILLDEFVDAIKKGQKQFQETQKKRISKGNVKASLSKK